MSSPLYCYDFTLGCEFVSHIGLLKDWLKQYSKKWVFQKEKALLTGWFHYQGRLSLKEKCRLDTLKNKCPWMQIHLSPTSNENRDNMFYVTKDDTRVDGPWSDKDIIRYIPRHIRKITTLLPWQSSLMEYMNKEDDRTIHCIVDDKYGPRGNGGNKGKSTFTTLLGCQGKAHKIPFCNDYKDIMRMVMDRPKIGCYILDMPRGVNKEKLRQLFGAIETVKDGWAYDDRYEFREEYFDIPCIFVFTNKIPDLSLLTEDRWNLLTISNDYKLIPYDLNFLKGSNSTDILSGTILYDNN